MAAAEGDGELPFAPAWNLLAVCRPEPRACGLCRRFEGDDAEGRTSVYQEGGATVFVHNVDQVAGVDGTDYTPAV